MVGRGVFDVRISPKYIELHKEDPHMLGWGSRGFRSIMLTSPWQQQADKGLSVVLHLLRQQRNRDHV